MTMNARTILGVVAFATMAAIITTPRAQAADSAIATFAAGCFWCVEADFDKVKGVTKTISGFMGGSTKNPTYNEVVSGNTGHAEAVQITYDPTKVSFKQLLDVYWRNVDPFNANGQFCDTGSHYRPIIFTHSPEQKRLAEESKRDAAATLKDKFKQSIVVKIENASAFTAASEKHQNFYKTNAWHYSRYRIGCGRDARLRQIWGAPVASNN